MNTDDYEDEELSTPTDEEIDNYFQKNSFYPTFLTISPEELSLFLMTPASFSIN
jgi:hypothetical protein